MLIADFASPDENAATSGSTSREILLLLGYIIQYLFTLTVGRVFAGQTDRYRKRNRFLSGSL